MPSPWGVRRDEYKTRADRPVHQQVVTYRAAASEAASALLASPLFPAFEHLLPGTLEAAVGESSSLLLADYFVLTLHHLVWADRLSLTPQVRWIEGDSVADDRYYVISRLPVDAAEASMLALILLEETATRAVRQNLCPERIAEGGADFGPPPRRPATHGPRARSRGDEVVADDIRAEHGPCTTHEGSDALALDEATLTIRFGDHAYRFRGRNKQLFSLLQRITRRPGHRVVFDDLRSVGDVWDGAQVEDSTIRGAIARLRKLLRDHGMGPIADQISSGSYRGACYVVFDTAREDAPEA